MEFLMIALANLWVPYLTLARVSLRRSLPWTIRTLLCAAFVGAVLGLGVGCLTAGSILRLERESYPKTAIGGNRNSNAPCGGVTLYESGWRFVVRNRLTGEKWLQEDDEGGPPPDLTGCFCVYSAVTADLGALVGLLAGACFCPGKLNARTIFLLDSPDDSPPAEIGNSGSDQIRGRENCLTQANPPRMEGGSWNL